MFDQSLPGAGAESEPEMAEQQQLLSAKPATSAAAVAMHGSHVPCPCPCALCGEAAKKRLKALFGFALALRAA